MYREINSIDEIGRRLLYIVYLGLMVAIPILGILGLAQHRVDYLGLMAVLVVASVLFRSYGKRRLDFERLGRSFPYGATEDDPEEDLRGEVERLLEESAGIDDDWPRRQELRNRLLALLEEDPRLWPVFRERIKGVFPALASWAGGGGASSGTRSHQ